MSCTIGIMLKISTSGPSLFPFQPLTQILYLLLLISYILGGANPAVNTPRPSRGTRIESCDFIVLIGDP